jgi:O-antigen/teichoic acid export membrane protein
VAEATTRDEPRGLSRVVARGVGVVGFSGVVVQIVMLATYIVLARLAPPEVFGTFAAASILVAFGTLFVESGMTAALIHRSDRIEEAAATAFVSTILGGLCLALLSAALAPVVGAVFESGEITTIAFVIAGMHLVNATTIVPNALLQRQFAYVRRALVDPVWMATYGALAAALLATGHGVWGLVMATYGAGVARAVLVWALLGRPLPVRRASFGMWRELAGYARHVLASEFLREAGMVAHTVGIGRFLSTADLGQFNFGNRVASQAGAPIVTSSANVLFPAFARMATDRGRLATGFKRALASLSFATVPLSLGFFAFGQSLVVLLLGERWKPAGDVLTSLCLVGAALALISISSELFKATGRPELLPRIHLFSALVPIVAVLVGVWFDIVVIGACASVGLMVVAAVALRIASRVVGLPIRALAAIVVPPFLVAAIVYGLFFLVERNFVESSSHGTAVGLLLLGVEAAVAASLYAAAMRVVVPSTTAEFFGSLRHLRRAR